MVLSEGACSVVEAAQPGSDAPASLYDVCTADMAVPDQSDDRTCHLAGDGIAAGRFFCLFSLRGGCAEYDLLLPTV